MNPNIEAFSGAMTPQKVAEKYCGLTFQEANDIICNLYLPTKWEIESRIKLIRAYAEACRIAAIWENAYNKLCAQRGHQLIQEESE